MGELGAGVNRISASVRETASLCGVHRGTVERWIREGLPCVRIGRKRLVRIETLDRWLRDHEHTEDERKEAMDIIRRRVLGRR